MNQAIKVPKTLKLQDGTVVTIRVMLEHEVVDAYRLIQLPEVFDKGFGVETYGDEAIFCLRMTNSFNYIVQEKSSSKVVAYIMVHTSRFYRGVSGADTLVVVPPEHRSQQTLQTCLGLALSIAEAAGFRGLYVDTFSTNDDVITVIKTTSGFTEVARLPGATRDGREETSYIYFKSLEKVSKRFHCCL